MLSAPQKTRGGKEMAIDIHIKFDGIDGESTDRDHKGEIEVLSWNWGLSAQPSTGGGSGAGRASAQDFSFIHHYDKSSPLLAKAGASGRAIRQVTLAARHAGQGQKDFLKVTMKEVIITAVQPSGSEEQGIAESVSVRSRQIAFDYQPTDSKGQLGNSVTFSWDIAAGNVT
jgi:type VI secretion system secreted protein Hcp